MGGYLPILMGAGGGCFAVVLEVRRAVKRHWIWLSSNFTFAMAPTAIQLAIVSAVAAYLWKRVGLCFVALFEVRLPSAQSVLLATYDLNFQRWTMETRKVL